MSGHSGDINKEIRGHWMIFEALLFFTFITVAISRFHFSTHIAVSLALAVALFKGSLVAGFFMHLLSERQLIYSILIFTIICFFGLLLLPFINDIDRLVGTRDTGKAQQTVQLQEKKEAGHDVH